MCSADFHLEHEFLNFLLQEQWKMIFLTALVLILHVFNVSAEGFENAGNKVLWRTFNKKLNETPDTDFANPRILSRHKRNVDLFDPHRNAGLVCSLCLIVDQQFLDAHKLADHSSMVSTVYNMVDKISWIFRNIDWNDDMIPDNFGFEIISLSSGWKPFPDEEVEDYEVPRPSLDLLAKFAELDFRSCCLGVGITFRRFQENQVGVSFIASQKLMGGVCDYRNPPPPLLSANCALISGRGIDGSVLSLKDVETVLLHELGHAFGVLRHDKDIVQLGSPECSGFLQDDVVPADYLAENVEPPKGRYIMWGQELQGNQALKVNHLKFSPCSRRAVVEIFRMQEGRSSCLKVDDTPFCGNGRLEHPEECDCGNEITCNADRCCGPRGSTVPCKLFKGVNPNDCVLTKAARKTPKKSVAPLLRSTVQMTHTTFLVFRLLLCIH